MGALSDKIEEDLKIAFKGGDTAATSLLRLVKSSLVNERIAKMKDLSEEEEVAVLRRELKKRDDAIELYTKAGDVGRTESERKEASLIKAYLPPEMSQEDIRTIVKSALAASGITGKENFGKAMSAAMAELKGKASGDVIGAIVREELS
jgi:uncharacterized protein YqeY